MVAHRLYFVCLAVVLLVSFPAAAQEAEPTLTNIETVERCIRSIGEAPDDWTFAGTIITWSYTGVHGFRADTPSRYYIAFSNDNEYSAFGALSPDGQWFASYVGRTESTRDHWLSYYLTAIRVVSTSPSRATYLVPFNAYEYAGSLLYPPVIWLDDTQFAAYEAGWGTDRWIIANPFTESVREATLEESNQFHGQLPNVSEWGGLRQPLEFSVEQVSALPSLPHAFMVRSPSTLEGRLYILDSGGNLIYDTCLDITSLALSPDGNLVAISTRTKNGFVYVVDLDAWAAYRLDLASDTIVAWVGD